MPDFNVALIDYDPDLFTPPATIAGDLAPHGIGWSVGLHATPEAALEAARDCEVVMIQSTAPTLDRALIAQLRRCRCIVRLGVGYDNVDVAAATERGIMVCNAPEYCIDDVADHTVALLLGCVRHVPRQDRAIREGRWDRTLARPARRLRGSTLGLVGFGKIGRMVAQRVRGFDLALLAYDPHVDEVTVARHGARKVGLPTLLTEANLVSLHLPLMESTHHLFGAREFGALKQGAIIVNTSRGPLIDEAALVDALRSGKLWAAGLDVMEHEPLPDDSPLRALDNVILTPHVSANSEQSVADLYRTAVEIAIAVQRGERPPGLVNPEVLDH
jgi:D-3-phosphoglycerate dehydrogenase / 2-oxoglutarate reductase